MDNETTIKIAEFLTQVYAEGVNRRIATFEKIANGDEIPWEQRWAHVIDPARTGAGIGALLGGGASWLQGRRLNDILQDALLGGAVGGASGGAFGYATNEFPRVIEEVAEAPGDISPEEAKGLQYELPTEEQIREEQRARGAEGANIENAMAYGAGTVGAGAVGQHVGKRVQDYLREAGRRGIGQKRFLEQKRSELYPLVSNGTATRSQRQELRVIDAMLATDPKSKTNTRKLRQRQVQGDRGGKLSPRARELVEARKRVLRNRTEAQRLQSRNKSPLRSNKLGRILGGAAGAALPALETVRAVLRADTAQAAEQIAHLKQRLKRIDPSDPLYYELSSQIAELNEQHPPSR